MKQVLYGISTNIRHTVQNLVTTATWRPGFVQPMRFYPLPTENEAGLDAAGKRRTSLPKIKPEFLSAQPEAQSQ